MTSTENSARKRTEEISTDTVRALHLSESSHTNVGIIARAPL